MAKQQLLESNVLVHYDPAKPMSLACDASPYGIVAVISHIMENGEERLIAFASRTIKDSENYAQIERECLAIIFGVRKFHKYVYGRKFTLITDHQPLTKIFGPKTGVPILAALRLQRWSLILQAHQYEIRYRKSADHANADALSRLPWEDSKLASEAKINYFTNLEDLPVSAKDISEETRKDPILSKVLENTLNGWMNFHQDPALTPYARRNEQLSVDQGCLLWGMRVVIPPKYQDRLLYELHENHPGTVRMKAMARTYLRFPGIDQEIENIVNGCDVCQLVRNAPAEAPLHPWRFPPQIWERVHLDFAEKNNQMFLVVVDSFSK